MSGIAETYFAPNLTKVVKQECHPDLRDTSVFEFLLALIAPLIAINEDFKASRLVNLEAIKVIRSTASFEKLLNDRFDGTLRRIRIVNQLPGSDESIINSVDAQSPTSLMYGIDENPAWQMTLRGVNDQENPVNFIVQIPAALNTESIRDGISKIIERFKLLTTNWIFEVL